MWDQKSPLLQERLLFLIGPGSEITINFAENNDFLTTFSWIYEKTLIFILLLTTRISEKSPFCQLLRSFLQKWAKSLLFAICPSPFCKKLAKVSKSQQKWHISVLQLRGKWRDRIFRALLFCSKLWAPYPSFSGFDRSCKTPGKLRGLIANWEMCTFKGPILVVGGGYLSRKVDFSAELSKTYKEKIGVGSVLQENDEK